MRRCLLYPLFLWAGCIQSGSPETDPPAPTANPREEAPSPLPSEELEAAEPSGAQAPVRPLDGCPADGWCWVQGRPILGVVGGSDSTVVAFGAEGSVLHWRRQRWDERGVPTRAAITSAWMTEAGQLWATDQGGGLWQHNGRCWSETPIEEALYIAEVTGSSDGTVWAHGGAAAAHGAISAAGLWRSSEEGWVRVPDPPAYCMGGDFLALAPDDVWSAGLVCEDDRVIGARAHHFDGDVWQPAGELIEAGWYPSLQLADGRVQMESSGPPLEWDGTTWQAIERMYPQGLPAGQRAIWNGVGHSIVPSSTGCSAVFRLDDDNQWCFGEGQIYRRQGERWSQTIAEPFAQTRLASEWGTMPARLWAGEQTFEAWGSAPDDIYRFGASGALEHHDGQRWTRVLEGPVSDLDGSDASNIWLVRDGALLHFDGSTHSELAVPAEYGAVAVVAVYALADSVVVTARDETAAQMLLSLHGERWSQLLAPTERWTLPEVAGSSLDDLWVVRTSGGRVEHSVLMHHDATAWREVEEWMYQGVPRLHTHGSETWLLERDALRSVSSPGEVVPIDTPPRSTLWVGDDAFWVSTGRQALMHNR